MSADKSVGRAGALRRSMLALIEKGEPHEAHPAYWAPFVVVGEGSVAVATGLQVPKPASTQLNKATRKPRPKGDEPWTVEIWKR
jgi:hypothetical protein